MRFFGFLILQFKNTTFNFFNLVTLVIFWCFGFLVTVATSERALKARLGHAAVSRLSSTTTYSFLFSPVPLPEVSTPQPLLCVSPVTQTRPVLCSFADFTAQRVTATHADTTPTHTSAIFNHATGCGDSVQTTNPRAAAPAKEELVIWANPIHTIKKQRL